ncbi:MAG: aldo/keto reductase [Hyphomicrobiaceae bacterium]
MHYTTLGRTGIRVSVAGLGCGGNSRIGLGAGLDEAGSIAIVRAARDLGVNFFDTAEVYGTEELLGKALNRSERSEVVISTKSRYMKGTERMSADEVVANLDASLRRLGTDHVDVFMLHGVKPADVAWCREALLPALLKARDAGKARHIGISTSPPYDPDQTAAVAALEEPAFEVMMLAFHMLHQGARRDLFPRTQALGVGTLMMFVVRNIFSRPGLLNETVARLVAEGKLDGAKVDASDPLGFLVRDGSAASLIDAAYRFVRHEPGSDVVLFGTSSIAHLRSNIASILAPPLPAGDVARVHALFGALSGVGLDLPDHVKPAA